MITISHTFETAHRLPQLGNKCVSLHGHSWRAETSIVGQVSEQGIVIDFGQVKAGWRTWIDLALDHGTMLGAADPLVPALLAAGCKIFRFGKVDRPVDGENLTHCMDWPTVENVAELLHRVARGLVEDLGMQLYGEPERWQVHHTTVHEKHDNAARFPAPDRW
jgi:6-pyruvoyltetrahydropterin/6-carboxytetrahydropterin synthase